MHLPEPLLEVTVAAAHAGHRVCLVVRHAERGPIHDLARHHEVPLTDHGHACAKDGGRRLGAKLRAQGTGRTLAYAHSPVHRCAQTAQGIAAGLREGHHDVTDAGVLDGFGADYLLDPHEVVRLYASGAHAFVRRWFDGGIAENVIASRDVVVDRVMGAARALLAAHPFSVAVTHDWNVAAVRETALGVRLEHTGWPAFLDGFVVVDDGARVVVRGA
jgi:broad specificity phosphatase PhoE